MEEISNSIFFSPIVLKLQMMNMNKTAYFISEPLKATATKHLAARKHYLTNETKAVNK